MALRIDHRRPLWSCLRCAEAAKLSGRADSCAAKVNQEVCPLGGSGVASDYLRTGADKGNPTV